VADAMRAYFDSKVPIRGEDPATKVPVPQRTWQQAWTNLSKQLFVVTPQQLDRCKSFRDRFASAVR